MDKEILNPLKKQERMNEPIFINCYDDMKVMLTLIGKDEKESTVVIADDLWDHFLYIVAGPLMPLDKLSKAKEDGMCWLEYTTFFTNSKWVKGNPPKKTFNQEVIDQAIAKIKQGIKQIEKMQEENFIRHEKQMKGELPFTFSGIYPLIEKE